MLRVLIVSILIPVLSSCSSAQYPEKIDAQFPLSTPLKSHLDVGMGGVYLPDGVWQVHGRDVAKFGYDPFGRAILGQFSEDGELAAIVYVHTPLFPVLLSRAVFSCGGDQNADYFTEENSWDSGYDSCSWVSEEVSMTESSVGLDGLISTDIIRDFNARFPEFPREIVFSNHQILKGNRYLFVKYGCISSLDADGNVLLKDQVIEWTESNLQKIKAGFIN